MEEDLPDVGQGAHEGLEEGEGRAEEGVQRYVAIEEEGGEEGRHDEREEQPRGNF